jgi:hypothetical protein
MARPTSTLVRLWGILVDTEDLRHTRSRGRLVQFYNCQIDLGNYNETGPVYVSCIPNT